MRKYYLRQEVSEEINKELSEFPELARELLFNREVETAEEARRFLNPDYEKHLYSPFLMRDMEKAVERILKALRDNERIVIFSDFDADGISAGVILHDLLVKLGYKNFRNYIPHRHEEGYGLSRSAVENFLSDGSSLLITTDCGIGDEDALELAADLGIEVIVTDHHIPTEKEPPALAVLNPKIDEYPDKHLCGAGVAFKLAQAVIEKGDFDLIEGWEKWLLDMVGLATIADMVPLKGENRVLAYYGLLVLQKSRRAGLLEMCKLMRTTPSAISEDDVGFMIAPRINAVSRMEAPQAAFDLLASRTSSEAASLASYVQTLNERRKGVVASMIKEIRSKIEEGSSTDEVIVTGNPKWKPSLLGLAANSLVKEYSRPVFLWGREGNGTLKGSCRSDGSVDLSELMAKISDVLIGYGGHKWAGGFSVSFDDVHHLKENINRAYGELASEVSQKEPIDKAMSIEAVNWSNYKIIRSLAPFGEGNPKPLFLFKDVFVDSVNYFGKNSEHIKLSLKKSTGERIQGVSFFARAGDFEKEPVKGEYSDIVASIESSDFGGQTHLRLRVVDVV